VAGDSHQNFCNRIEGFINNILCTSKWSKSMQDEEKKLDNKKRVHFLKLLKDFKNNNPECRPCLPDIACKVIRSLGNYREIVHCNIESRKKLARYCVESICRHICMLNKLCVGVITDCKLKHISVGLLYLMRNGIVMHGIVILPKLDGLSAILPIESHLQSIFLIKGKCITETENIVKIVLRGIPRNELVKEGVTGTCDPLPFGNASFLT
jgi:uncharacterized protein YeeX (DUF496 family)